MGSSVVLRRRCVRGAGRKPAAARTFFDKHQFGVQIIGERNDEKEQHHGADKRGPFAPFGVAAAAALARPPSAPENHSRDGDHEPENIKE